MTGTAALTRPRNERRADGRRRLCRAGVAVLVAISGLALAGPRATAAAAELPLPPVGTITNLGLGISNPVHIVTGPDGALWFANRINSSIGRITVRGELSNFPTTGTDGLHDVALGPDGNLWFTSIENDVIGRMTPAGDVTTYPVDGPYPVDGVYEITEGPDGNLWFTGLYGSVGRITPDGVVTLFSSADISGLSVGITAGSDGNLWFTTGDGIGRVTPAGVITSFTSAAVQSPGSIALGSDGNVWFTNQFAATLGRITPTGAITSFPLPTVWGAEAITPGPDGALWYTNNQEQTLGRMSTSGVGSIVASLPQGMAGLTTGPDGKVWVTNAAEHTISRVTRNGQVSTFRDSISFPVDLVSDGDDNLWIANELTGISRRAPDGTMTRFDDPALERPKSLAIGPDGNVWMTAEGGVVRMTPAGVATTFTHPDMLYLYGITVGPDGNLWFTYRDGGTFTQGGIGTITTTGAITLHPIGTSSLPNSITTGPDGNLWFTDAFNSIGRFTPGGVLTRFVDSSVISSPGGIVAGPDGNLWFANSGGWKIGRITPAGVITGFPAALGTLDLAVGPDGNIWYTSHCENIFPCPKSTVGLMTMAGATADFTGDGVDLPVAIASGPDGDLFFANFINSSLGRVVAIGSPLAPMSVTAVPGSMSATVSWSPPVSDGGSPITSYAVVAAPGGQSCIWSAGPLACTFTGLTNGTAYTFAVSATNGHGSGPSATSEAVVPVEPVVPSAPTIGIATGGNRRATVSWTAPVSDGHSPITGYVVTPYAGGRPLKPVVVAPTTTTQTVTGLANGTTYRFRVQAMNAIGTGPRSQPSNPVTPAR